MEFELKHNIEQKKRVHCPLDNFAFTFRVSCFVWMVYLSHRVMICPLTPFCVLLSGRAHYRAAARPPCEGMRLLKCVDLGVQQERALNQCEH